LEIVDMAMDQTLQLPFSQMEHPTKPYQVEIQEAEALAHRVIVRNPIHAGGMTWDDHIFPIDPM